MTQMITIDPAQPNAGMDPIAANFFASGRNMLVWREIWASSGIRHAQRSPESEMNVPRASGEASIAFPEASTPAVGDLIVQWDGVSPDEFNQRIHRVSALDPALDGSGEVTARITSPLPRGEWPDAMQDATVPTDVFLQVNGNTVEITRAGGLVSQFDLPRVAPLALFDKAVEAIVAAARKGHSDSYKRAHRGNLSVREGTGEGGLGGGGRTWQIVDEAGSAIQSFPRSLMHRGPPQEVLAILAGAYEANMQGQREGYAAQQRDMVREYHRLKSEEAAPGLR